jgi:hypothetical protein
VKLKRQIWQGKRDKNNHDFRTFPAPDAPVAIGDVIIPACVVPLAPAAVGDGPKETIGMDVMLLVRDRLESDFAADAPPPTGILNSGTDTSSVRERRALPCLDAGVDSSSPTNMKRFAVQQS